MLKKITLKSVLALGLLVLPVWGVTHGFSQEVTEAHLKAARDVMKETGALGQLNEILPSTATLIKAQLITNRPDIENEISVLVDEVAISLAARRSDLNKEVAAVYTRLFTEEELVAIAQFFSGEAGKKFLQLAPVILREVDEAGRVWRAGITRDMQIQVQEQMVAQGLQ